MKSKNITLIAALVTGLGALAAPLAAHAQKAGQNTVSIGVFSIRTDSTSEPLSTTLLPVPINGPLALPGTFVSQGTSLSTSNATTLGANISHYFTDNIALTAFAGIPPRFKIYGRGVLKPPGPAGALSSQNLGDPAINPVVADSLQWSLASVVQYHFFEPDAKIRPFIGLGASYNFYSSIKVNQAFANAVSDNMGATLAAGAGKPGRTTVEVGADPSWAPVFNLGANYNIDENWALTLSGTYIPLTTTSTTKIKAADGTVLAVSKTRIKPNPVIFFAGATYKF